ncbi:MAG: 4Fe-4S dicluster domain-containing protein [Proteobacteria bacterium]|nr:4Fe-4S dicluster domain-containing protein [Pseudomonadota bacterium]
MHAHDSHEVEVDEFIENITKMSGEDFSLCYQCGKCTAGCPMADVMDFPPTLVMRYMQMGLSEELKKATSRWDCVGCLVCGSRCPKFCNPAKVMESLRLDDIKSGRRQEEIEALPVNFLKKAPQQAIVSGFRKYVP